jgi:hypothetical protein
MLVNYMEYWRGKGKGLSDSVTQVYRNNNVLSVDSLYFFIITSHQKIIWIPGVM